MEPAAPLLGRASRRVRTTAFVFCLLEVPLSLLLWVGRLLSSADPAGTNVYFFGLPVATLWSLGAQFLYYAARAVLFIFVANLVAPEKPI